MYWNMTMYSYYERAKIKSYDSAAKFFARARHPESGKPVMRWCRLFKVDDTYELRTEYLNRHIATFHPDNTLELVADKSTMRAFSSTLTGCIDKAIPVLIQRVGVGRYMVITSRAVDRCRESGSYENLKTMGNELFDGIRFDLNTITHECINPKPSILDGVVPEKRREWLRQLRAFKKGMKVRIKLGVLDSVCAQVTAQRNRTNQWQKPDWHSDEWTNKLYESIRDQDFSPQILEGFVQSSYVAYWRMDPPTPQKAYEAMEEVIQALSIELRRKFGVFGEHT